MGWARAPASLLAVDEAEPEADVVELPVLELEPLDVVDEPELLPLVEEEPPDVPLVLPPVDEVPLVLEPEPTLVVPLVGVRPVPAEGEATGMRVLLTMTAVGVYVGVPAGLVATAG